MPLPKTRTKVINRFFHLVGSTSTRIALQTNPCGYRVCGDASLGSWFVLESYHDMGKFTSVARVVEPSFSLSLQVRDKPEIGGKKKKMLQVNQVTDSLTVTVTILGGSKRP